MKSCDHDARELRIDWGDEHRSRYALDWLRENCLSQGERARRRSQPRLWGRDIARKLPCQDYARIADSPERQLNFLETLLELGFVILRGVPAAAERTEEVTGLVGKLRLTNYGIYELKSKPNPEIVGDMALPIEPHTDEPYRIDPPGITFFHVIRQADEGGASTLLDGFNLAARLRREKPGAFAILNAIPARFHRNLIEGRRFEYQSPIIRTNSDGDVIAIRLLDRGMAPVDCVPDQVEPFYDALRVLLEYVRSGDDRIEFRLESGDMLVFNNQRLMHGRTAFDAASGRHVRTCHVDLDEFHSRLRVMYRQRNDPRCWHTYRRD